MISRLTAAALAAAALLLAALSTHSASTGSAGVPEVRTPAAGLALNAAGPGPAPLCPGCPWQE